MNKYRKKLFQHLDGIVLIPTITGLNKSGLLKLIINKQKFSIKELSNDQELNTGYLNVSLRVLRSSGLLEFKHQNNEMDSRYSINKEIIKITREINKLKDLDDIIEYHIHFRKLKKIQVLEYTNLVNKLNLFLINNKEKFTDKFYNNLEGLIVGPLLANLSFYKHIQLKSKSLNLINLEPLFKKSIINIFQTLKFISDNKNITTTKGDFFFTKSSSYGVTVSYLATLSNINTLLIDDNNYIWKRNKNNDEIHVDRSMNVWGSGGSHKIYFKKINKIIINIFNQDIENQPLGIIDIGCGDGTFLKYIYSIIITQTKRKEYIEKYPIILIGTDINQKARNSAKNTLKGIENIIIDGDISNPSQINNILIKKYNLKLNDFLNCRTFLDHNRIYEKPKKEIKHNITSNGSFCFKGSLISSEDLITNFIIHLSSWKPYIKRHGLIIVELHTIDPIDTLKNSGRSLACAYDATHGYSDQYLIEYDTYKKCINNIGMRITKNNEYLFPDKLPTVSINYIK